MNSDLSPIHAVCPNDFDVAFADSMSTPLQSGLEQGALPWLNLWTAQHPHRLPSAQELESLAVLAHAREEQITAWLNRDAGTKCPNPSSITDDSRTTSKAHRPKCIDSRWRYRYRGPQEEGLKIFECTHRCGQSFSRQRKGDWARHERVNFEEWICPICHGALSRREKLRGHLRDFHSSPDAVQESHRHLTLCVSRRPCGFCRRQLSSWSEWLAHVGAHFEGLLPGGEQTMAQWKDEPSSASLSDSGMDIDMGDADSGFFSFEATSIASTDNHHSHRRLQQSRTSARTSLASRIAPPILENPRPDIYNAPDPTIGQPYAFPDPENQWSLQTMQSLLGCWTEESAINR